MKYLSIIVLALPLLAMVAFTSCNNKGKGKGGKQANELVTDAGTFVAEPGQGTALHFAHLTMQFGPVTSGDTVKAAYPFKNVTNTAVTISAAITSCPCMMTDYPKGPIQPGEVGEIKVNFATANQFGTHEKIIAVTLQGNNEPITLRLNGKINQK